MKAAPNVAVVIRTLALAGAGLGAALVAPAQADGRLEARYRASIAGMELGRASIVLDISDTSYTASASGRVTGVMQAVSSGKGSVGARGLISGGRMVPQNFTLDAESSKKNEEVRLALAATGVKDVQVEPPVKPSKDRVPVTDADKKGVLDPFTAALVLMPPTGDMVVPAACDRVLSIFDGRQRFDLALSFVRTEPIKVEKGYDGPSVVCRVAYMPISGHRPARPQVKYMQENKDIYVWLAPVAGTRVLAPIKVSVSTMIGTAELEATSFTTGGGDGGN